MPERLRYSVDFEYNYYASDYQNFTKQVMHLFDNANSPAPQIAREAIKFLPSIKKGDKRIFIINGKVKGCITRVPSKNSNLSNLSQGGTAIKCQLTIKEKKIASIIAKKLKKDKIFFAGIDFVSGYLIGDINVTSPTGLPQLKDLTGNNLAKYFWDEARKLK